MYQYYTKVPVDDRVLGNMIGLAVTARDTLLGTDYPANSDFRLKVILQVGSAP